MSLIAAAVAAYVALCGPPLAIAVVVAGNPDEENTGCAGDGGPGGGSSTVGTTRYSGEELDNARTIVDVALHRRLPRRAAVLAVATSIVESGLRNLDHGDRDSLGLFQQRPSQGWGSPAQILNPTYAAAQFYNHLTAVPRWETLPPGQAEQQVQGSAYPGRYAPQEPNAERIVARYWRGPDHPAPRPRAQPEQDPRAATRCDDQGKSTLDSKKAGVPKGFRLPAEPRRRAAVSFALAQVGKPYVWGAKGPDAYDCSGLTQAAWAHAGIGISSGTVNQVHDGHPVASIAGVQPGDLLFTPGSLGSAATPRHVGLYAGHGLVVNAYDTSTGVITQPLDTWAHDTVAIRRIT